MESFQTPAGQMAADTLAGADVSPGPLFLFGLNQTRSTVCIDPIGSRRFFSGSS